MIGAFERRKKIMVWRSHDRLSYPQIVAKAHEYFGTENLPNQYGVRKAQEDVRICMDKMAEQIAEQGGRLIARQAIELREMYSRVWLDTFDEQGYVDQAGVRLLLQIHKREAKLLGLDKVHKQEIDVHKYEYRAFGAPTNEKRIESMMALLPEDTKEKFRSILKVRETEPIDVESKPV